MPNTEHHEPQYSGFWVPDFICDRIKTRQITPSMAIIWSLVSNWTDAGWQYDTSKSTIKFIENKTGFTSKKINECLAHMKVRGVIQ